MTDDHLLRPDSWGSYVGQAAVKERLQVECRAALEAGRRLEHILVTGPPGTGKSTLAELIAGESGERLTIVTRPLDVRGLMRALWTFEEFGGVLFIDEIHTWSKTQQEPLLQLLEDGYVESKWGRESFPSVSVMAATTEGHQVGAALQSRFMVRLHMADYSHDELTQIVVGMAQRAGVELDTETCAALAVASNGVPRQARSLVLGARNLIACGERPDAARILSHCGISEDGLSVEHETYLAVLERLGGQAGMETLSTRLQLHRTQVMQLERLLIDRRYVVLDPRGRVLTGAGRRRIDNREAA